MIAVWLAVRPCRPRWPRQERASCSDTSVPLAPKWSRKYDNGVVVGAEEVDDVERDRVLSGGIVSCSTLCCE